MSEVDIACAGILPENTRQVLIWSWSDVFWQLSPLNLENIFKKKKSQFLIIISATNLQYAICKRLQGLWTLYKNSFFNHTIMWNSLRALKHKMEKWMLHTNLELNIVITCETLAAFVAFLVLKAVPLKQLYNSYL
jgi:hypothetical protein